MMATAIDLSAQRRFYAEEIQIASNIKSPALVDALAAVPRERFLGPGPWTIKGEADFQQPSRQTPSGDPRFVYHNVAIAIDPARTLFNGAPGLLLAMMEALGVAPGKRVAHVGTGTGYYTAVMAEAVGNSGRVTGIEVDPDLAKRAAENLAPWPWVTVSHGDGRGLSVGDAVPKSVDAIFVNAGVTHVLPEWIDALAPGGRMIIPLTATMAGPMGPAMANIGKGLVLLISRTDNPWEFDARLVTFVGIYSAIGLRDDALNARIGAALAKMPFPQLKKFRLDRHEPTPACWLHDDTGCWAV